MQEASGTISGPGAYGKLKFESGIHRVQVWWIDDELPYLYSSHLATCLLIWLDPADGSEYQ